MRVFFTAVAYLVSLAIVAVVTFFAVIFLAGPHGGVLPGWLEPAVVGLGWLMILALPAWVAYWVWRRLGRTKSG